LSSIETEARVLLMKRRQALRRSEAVPAGELAMGDEAGSGTDSVRTEIEEIEAALGRIDEGRYGNCVSCGGPLGLQRLRAIPEARYCVGCSGHRPAAD
jgi:hypothetical protein